MTFSLLFIILLMGGDFLLLPLWDFIRNYGGIKERKLRVCGFVIHLKLPVYFYHSQRVLALY